MIDTIQLYLEEIGGAKLLKPTQEQQYGWRIKSMQQAKKELNEHPDHPCRPALEFVVADGELAWQLLVNANLRLVVSIAKNYKGQNQADLAELISTGNEGLMKAALKFDPGRGFRFSTYATWWVRQAITRYINEHTRTVRLPVHLSERIAQVKRARAELLKKNGGDPGVADLAEATGFTPRQVAWALKHEEQSVSLDYQPPNSSKVRDPGNSILNTIPAPDETIIEIVTQDSVAEIVHQALGKLDERERHVMALRYGIKNGGKRQTLGEIGNGLGLTRERVRQIEAEAMRKMRGAKELQGLMDA